MPPPPATRVIESSSKSAQEIQDILSNVCGLSGEAPATLICIDLDAEPPHSTRSELRLSLAKVGEAAVECLNGYTDHTISVIVLSAGCRVTITPRPLGYTVSVDPPKVKSVPANLAPSHN